MKNKLMVLFGGKSVEHDISIITAMQALKNLPKAYDFLPVYVDKNGVWWTAENLQDAKISIFQTVPPRAARSSLPEPVLEASPESASAAFSAP